MESEAAVEPVVRWLYPEYCSGPLFWGWWLYLRDRNDGSENDEGGWGWLKDGHQLRPVVRLLRDLGRTDVPEVPMPCPHANTVSRFSEWFAQRYPQGIRVQVVPQPEAWERVKYVAVSTPGSGEPR